MSIHFLAVGDISYQRQDQLASLGLDAPQSDFNTEFLSTLFYEFRFQRIVFAEFDLFPQLPVDVHVRRADDVCDMDRQQFIAAVAKRIARLSIDVDKGAFDIMQKECIGSLFDHGPEEFFTRF